PGAITIPAACTDAWRARPSIRVPSSRIFRTRSSWRASCRSSGDRSGASASVTETPGPAGIILVKRSTSPGSTRSVRATSRKAARASNVPEVMIAPAGAHRDASVLRRLYDVVDDQEVAGVPGMRDDLQLVVEPRLDLRGQRLSIALPRPGAREVHEQIVVGRELGRPRVLGEEVSLFEIEL